MSDKERPPAPGGRSYPAWLADLHWRDCATAKRILDRHGLAAFDRIARAATKEKRAAQRPKADLGKILLQAAFDWLTHPEWDEAETALQTAHRVVAENAWEGIAPLTETYLRRQLRSQLMDLPPDVLAAAEARARARGERTRMDPPAPPKATLTLVEGVREVARSPVVQGFRDLAQSPGFQTLFSQMQSAQSSENSDVAKFAPLLAKVPSREAAEGGLRIYHLARALAPATDDMDTLELWALLEDIQWALGRDVEG